MKDRMMNHQNAQRARLKPRSKYAPRLRHHLLTCLLIASAGCASARSTLLSTADRGASSTASQNKMMASARASNPQMAASRSPRPAQGGPNAPTPHILAAKATPSPRPVATGTISDTTSLPGELPGGNSPGAVMPVSYNQEVAPQSCSTGACSTGTCSTGACSTGTCSAPGCVHQDPSACGVCMPPAYAPVPPYWNDQEYLYDGGDREPKVQVTQDWNVRGLDSQDTVAHYETIDGKLCVAPSNRVPIYAPRFGAVRKMSAPILASRAVGAERVIEPTGAVVKASRDTAGDMVAPVGPKKQAQVKLIDGLRDRTRGVPAEKITQSVALSEFQAALLRLQENKAVARREDLFAVDSRFVVNARTWSNPEAIAISLEGKPAIEVRNAVQVQDVHVYETEPGKCSLRICKASSHAEANPGDIIQFSIRFENVGDKPIGNLSIHDSLVTRLEYIDGSQQCLLSLKAQKTSPDSAKAIKFSTAENEAGSTVLRWDCDLPLETGDSGVITFRCRVR